MHRCDRVPRRRFVPAETSAASPAATCREEGPSESKIRPISRSESADRFRPHTRPSSVLARLLHPESCPDLLRTGLFIVPIRPYDFSDRVLAIDVSGLCHDFAMTTATAEPLRVLVIDDEAAHAQVICEGLERAGYDCTIATSGQQGAR